MRAEEERSRLPESDLSPRDASFAGFLLSFFLPHFPLFLSLFSAIFSPSFRSLGSPLAYAWPLMFFIKLTLAARESTPLLSTPRRRVCIISFIIQLALNSTLFRGHDRSLRPHRPSSSFSLRSLLLYLAGHPAPPFTHAGCNVTDATHSHCSLIFSAVSVCIFLKKSSRFRLRRACLVISACVQ